jgi:hypothetical protein
MESDPFKFQIPVPNVLSARPLAIGHSIPKISPKWTNCLFPRTYRETIDISSFSE